MARTIVYSLLLLCASWALAQNNPKPTSSAASQAGSMSDSKTTVQGCLSSAGGNFSLTDNSGNTYQLAGDTSKLAEHVGHKIEVTGTTSPAGSPSGGTATSGGTAPSSGAANQQTLTVTSVKHIAPTCSTSR
jgi:hypothetical protein